MASNLPSCEVMQISVRIYWGKVITLEVQPSDSIENIKTKINVKEGILPALQRLIFEDEELEDCCILSNYSIQNNSRVDLFLRQRGSMQIMLRCAPREFTLDVEVSDSIADVKRKIQHQEGIPSSEVRLMVEGIDLRDRLVLSDYNIHNGSILDIALRLRGGVPPVKKTMEIFVKLPWKRSLTFEVTASDTVKSVKAKIEEQKGWNADGLKLFLEKILLEDDRILSDYNIQDRTTIYLIERMSSVGGPALSASK